MERQGLFEKKIAPILQYVGTIGALLTSIAYIAIVFVIINGFKIERVLNTTVFAIVNAGVGLIIMQFLKIQGISFASNLPENKEILKDYYNTRTRDKRTHSISYYWVTSVIKDICIKAAGIAGTSIGLVYIVIKGSNDYNLLLLAAVNLIMFICFGLLGLTKAYDFFNTRHIPFIIEKLKEVNEYDEKS